MPLDFPSNPAVGTYYNGYIWDGTVWDSALQPSVPALLTTAPVYANEAARTTAVPSPAEGQLSYLNDINQFQGYSGTSWRPVGGLSPMVPPTVSVSGGTASANSLGLVSFSAATSIQLNNVFTDNFNNYRIIFTCLNTAIGENRVRFVSGGSIQSGTNYKYGAGRAATNVFDSYGSNSNTYFPVGYSGWTSPGTFSASLDIYNPKISSSFTGFTYMGSGHDGTNAITLYGGGAHHVTNSVEAIQFYPASGTFTGTVQVFGYNS